MKRILVTGGYGFIGRVVCSTLESNNFKVYTASRRSGIDFSVKEDVDEYFLNNRRFDVIVHLAGSVWSDGDDREYLRNNINILTNLLTKNVPIIFASSASVYGADNINSKSKKICEGILKESGVPHTILRIFNPIGPGCKGIVDIMKENKGFKVFDQDSQRDYIDVRDVAEAIRASVAHPFTGGMYQLGTGVGTSLNDLIRLFESVSGNKLKYEIGSSDDSAIKHSIADITETTSELDWKPRYSLEESLKHLLNQN